MEKPSGFELRTVTMEVGAAGTTAKPSGATRYVVVARGELELEAVGGDSRRFGRGSVLCLVGLSLRALRSRGTEPAVLVAVCAAVRR